MISLLGSLMVALAIGWICDGTWDYAAYYHLTPSTEPWYAAVLRWSAALGIVALFLLGPAIVALIRRGIGRLKV
jgi:hypothetical protein